MQRIPEEMPRYTCRLPTNRFLFKVCVEISVQYLMLVMSFCKVNHVLAFLPWAINRRCISREIIEAQILNCFGIKPCSSQMTAVTHNCTEVAPLPENKIVLLYLLPPSTHTHAISFTVRLWFITPVYLSSPTGSPYALNLTIPLPSTGWYSCAHMATANSVLIPNDTFLSQGLMMLTVMITTVMKWWWWQCKDFYKGSFLQQKTKQYWWIGRWKDRSMDEIWTRKRNEEAWNQSTMIKWIKPNNSSKIHSYCSFQCS